MSAMLIDAIYEEDSAKVAKLLAKGVDPNQAVEKVSPLVEACGKSTVEVVELLLKAGADVNKPDEIRQHSPLTAACEAANLEIVQLLVSHGANANYFQRNVSTPLSEAASGEEEERIALVEFLLDVGADPKAVFLSQDGARVSNVLMVACELGLPETVELLIKAGSPVNQRLAFGTALISAVKEGREEIVRVLLKHGADPMIAAPVDAKKPEISGQNALELAVHKNKKKIAELLRKSKKQ